MTRHRGAPVVTFVAEAIIVTSVIGLLGLVIGWRWERYVQVFGPHMPEPLVAVRYAVSVLQRIIGLLCGIGLLYRREAWRRVGLVLFGFVICTMYWKYPLYGFEALTHTVYRMLFEQYAQQGLGLQVVAVRETILTLVPRVAKTAFDVVDTGFAAWFLYYFTRPHVQRQFT